MKYVIVDTNNISNIGFYRAKSVMIKEIQDKIKEEKEKGASEDELKLIEASLMKNISKNLKNFSIQIFINMIHKYFKENKNSKFLFVWDGKNGSKWRKEVLSSYKSNRDHSKEIHYNIFIDSVEEEKQLLLEYPVIQFQHKGAEADDLIYNLCEILQNEDVKVISGDSDFIQLPQKFNKTKIWNPRTKKIVKIPEYDYVTYKSIVGDSSDCIDGIFRFGPKKAEKAIAENLVNFNDEQKNKIEENKRIIDLSLNPSVEKNSQIVKKMFFNSKITMSLNNVKKIYFNLRLKNFLLKWDNIVEILKQLERESKNGEEEC